MPKVCPVCGTSYDDQNSFCSIDGSTLRVVESAESVVGSVVADRYLVTALLGEGGMGKVYLARHVRLPQQAAIKILRADLVRDPMAVARFNREASNASQIEAEHVARVYDYGETRDGLVYLAMEYVPGKTLRRIIESEGPLPPRRTAELIRQIAAGLDAAHDLTPPLIHRDLKPDNILVVTSASGRDRVKVVDFGIAKAFGSEDHALTRTGFVVGTPEFMSPEQLLGEPLDPRSDVYALALVAFECLTGTLPFDMTTPERARMARLVESPHHLLDSTPGVTWPESMEQLFESALSRDRTGRPASAGEFAQALMLAIHEEWPGPVPTTTGRVGLPTPAERRADTPPARPSPTPPSTPMPAPMPASMPASMPAIAPDMPTPDAPVPAARMPHVRSMEAPARRSRTRWLGAAVVVAVLVAGALLATRPRTSAEPTSQLAALTPPAPPVADSVAPPATPPGVAAPASTPAPRSAERPRDDAARVSGAAGGETSDDEPPSEARTAASALDSLVRALDGAGVDAPTARSLAQSMRALLPRLGRDDQVRANIGLVRAHILAGDVTAACSALRTATASARRAAQRSEIRRLDEQLGCE
ncbi:serine/threonine-protein kinase [Roseisolibacter agri]|uniref:Protein kinase domain-containing protein n=1 Tax=Roseisolibacter agri TaxID=2014610 RepID=A0AA37V6L4_9BACT|nr:serine/threonine-protein kinase [Roseisolibacter agri]GLC25481.1 hypothetical protein rosag_19940 [Roseisolibacter agri]